MAACKYLFNLGRHSLLQVQQSPILYTSVRYKLVRKNEKLASKSMNWSKVIYNNLMKDGQEEKNEAQPPALLHLVTRVKSMKGRPYWEKETLECLGLSGPQNRHVVHKNSPSVNHMLKSVKHLIKVVPITFPNGLPDDESDYEHCLLRDNGEFVVRKKLPSLDPAKVVPAPKSGKDVLWKMDFETLDRHLIQQLRHRRFNMEYFPAKYVYKFNQDGEEYRYKKNKIRDDDWY